MALECVSFVTLQRAQWALVVFLLNKDRTLLIDYLQTNMRKLEGNVVVTSSNLPFKKEGMPDAQ